MPDEWKENKIVDTYRSDGASAYIIRLEVEAWAVADMIDADSISRVLTEVCM